MAPSSARPQGHHRRTPPRTTSPPRAEESWGHAEAQAKAWVCGLLNLFSGEVNNWLFNPDTYTHTWSSKLLSPSWIKLPGKPWAAKMTQYPLQGRAGEEPLPLARSRNDVSLTPFFFLRELKCCECLCNRAARGRMLPAVELGIIGSSRCYKQPGRKLTSSLLSLLRPGSSKLERNAVSCCTMWSQSRTLPNPPASLLRRNSFLLKYKMLH